MPRVTVDCRLCRRGRQTPARSRRRRQVDRSFWRAVHPRPSDRGRATLDSGKRRPSIQTDAQTRHVDASRVQSNITRRGARRRRESAKRRRRSCRWFVLTIFRWVPNGFVYNCLYHPPDRRSKTTRYVTANPLSSDHCIRRLADVDNARFRTSRRASNAPDRWYTNSRLRRADEMRLGYTNYRLRELDQLLHRLTTRCVAASYVKYSRAHTFNVYRRSLCASPSSMWLARPPPQLKISANHAHLSRLITRRRESYLLLVVDGRRILFGEL